MRLLHLGAEDESDVSGVVVEPKWWKVQLIVRDDGCIMHHGRCGNGNVQGAHIISQQHLKRLGLSEFLWDTRNGMLLCAWHHNRHDRYLERVPRNQLPEGVEDFCEEHEIMYLLDKQYPKEEA